MVTDPNEPGRPTRIIIPGAEPEPEAAPRPKIILPPGISIETHDDLPDYPRLRAVQLTPVREAGRELLVVTDPLGVVKGQPVLGIETLAILQLLDGTTSLTDIQALVMQESKDLRVGNMVRDFIARLDELLLLHSPRFEAALAKLQAEWHPLEVRPAAFEGICYPAGKEPLEQFLNAHFEEAETRRQASGSANPATGVPRAILSPHLDPRREGRTMARALLEVDPVADAGPLRVVIFGTGHNLGDEFLALTRKRFETPLGQAACDSAFVDRVAARLGDSAWKREIVHRDEHSIEFQVLYLQHRLRGRAFSIVPILCGSFTRLLDERRKPREEPLIETLVAAVRDAEKDLGGRTLHVASVDFSHVGPRFGDPKPVGELADLVRDTDRAAIDAAASGEADRWFDAIAAGDDATRICGFAPTYCMLRAAEPGPGRELAYETSTEPDGTVVTVAAMAWP